MPSRIKRRLPQSFRTAIIIIGALCLCLFLLFQLVLRGYDEWHAKDYGHIRLRNNYELAKLNTEKHVLCHNREDSAGSELSDGVIIDRDIDAIAWDERYVFFHISDRQSEMENEHYQILDTQTGDLSAYRTMSEAELALQKLHVGNLVLKYTIDFFPETKTSSPHVFPE